MSELRVLQELLFLACNIAILGLNLKLYTEWWKERVKK